MAKNQRYIHGNLLTEIAIPSREVQDVYLFEILRRMDRYILQSDLYQMFDALFSDNVGLFSKILSDYIEQKVPGSI